MEDCVREAIFYMQKAIETLQDGLEDPQRWKQEQELQSRVLAKLIPAMTLLQLQETHIHPPSTVESSPGVHEEYQSDVCNFPLETDFEGLDFSPPLAQQLSFGLQ
jgi:hypothetical protein